MDIIYAILVLHGFVGPPRNISLGVTSCVSSTSTNKYLMPLVKSPGNLDNRTRSSTLKPHHQLSPRCSTRVKRFASNQSNRSSNGAQAYRLYVRLTWLLSSLSLDINVQCSFLCSHCIQLRGVTCNRCSYMLTMRSFNLISREWKAASLRCALCYFLPINLSAVVCQLIKYFFLCIFISFW